MKIAIFSDIHANLTALKAVLDHCFIKYGKDIPIIHLGDCIDYGMRPNDVIGVLSKLSSQMIANVEGNHEIALFGKKVERFSSERGVKANIYTKSILTDTSFSFIKEMKKSPCEMCIDNKMFLFVHGDLSEPHWGKMNIDEKKSSIYENYDYVISGHTHVSSLFYEINKNKCKKTIFINPGSIGQPRNCNVNAQYAVLDTETDSVYFEAVPYDYRIEQSLYSSEIDVYYKDRLGKGI